LLTDAADPLDYVFGYTIVNDVTARDLQRKDVQFTRAKSFDSFAPSGN
jgi:2-keto-4-pentenoate hydratase/2-oxohepta-3-ene-1,7-dioic acid hydratase in catechol pathway